MVVGGIKVWTNSQAIKRRLTDEVRRKDLMRKEGIHNRKKKGWKG